MLCALVQPSIENLKQLMFQDYDLTRKKNVFLQYRQSSEAQ